MLLLVKNLIKRKPGFFDKKNREPDVLPLAICLYFLQMSILMAFISPSAYLCLPAERTLRTD